MSHTHYGCQSWWSYNGPDLFPYSVLESSSSSSNSNNIITSSSYSQRFFSKLEHIITLVQPIPLARRYQITVCSCCIFSLYLEYISGFIRATSRHARASLSDAVCHVARVVQCAKNKVLDIGDTECAWGLSIQRHISTTTNETLSQQELFVPALRLLEHYSHNICGRNSNHESQNS